MLSIEYELIYGERVVRGVANNTRAEGRELFEEAAEALIALKHDAIRGAAVVEVSLREDPSRG